MDEKLDQVKGELKEQAGQATNDPELEREGQLDQAGGQAREAADKAKDAAKNALGR
jgi:uncharacterized protein YjbJ (UPF0337 family)